MYRQSGLHIKQCQNESALQYPLHRFLIHIHHLCNTTDLSHFFGQWSNIISFNVIQCELAVAGYQFLNNFTQRIFSKQRPNRVRALFSYHAIFHWNFYLTKKIFVYAEINYFKNPTALSRSAFMAMLNIMPLVTFATSITWIVFDRLEYSGNSFDNVFWEFLRKFSLKTIPASSG